MHALLTDVSAIRCTLAVRHRKKKLEQSRTVPACSADTVISVRRGSSVPSALVQLELSCACPCILTYGVFLHAALNVGMQAE